MPYPRTILQATFHVLIFKTIELQNIQKLSIACPYSKMFDYTIPNTKLSFLLKASI